MNIRLARYKPKPVTVPGPPGAIPVNPVIASIRAPRSRPTFPRRLGEAFGAPPYIAAAGVELRWGAQVDLPAPRCASGQGSTDECTIEAVLAFGDITGLRPGPILWRSTGAKHTRFM
jgi:hypothetical protein